MHSLSHVPWLFNNNSSYSTVKTTLPHIINLKSQSLNKNLNKWEKHLGNVILLFCKRSTSKGSKKRVQLAKRKQKTFQLTCSRALPHSYLSHTSLLSIFKSIECFFTSLGLVNVPPCYVYIKAYIQSIFVSTTRIIFVSWNRHEKHLSSRCTPSVRARLFSPLSPKDSFSLYY